MNKSNGKKRLVEGEDVALGVFITELRTPQLGPMLAAAGMDFAVIDMEHGAFSYETAAALILGCRSAGVSPFVRVPEIRKECFAKVLDAGAEGVLVPGVETVQEAEQVVKWTKYPPRGQRGVSLVQPHTGFEPRGRVHTTQGANEHTMALIQIETSAGVANVEDIAAVDGVDLLFVGPYDLAQSLSPESEEGADELVDRAIRHVLDCSRRKMCRMGIHMSNVTTAKALIEEGVRFITIGTDVSFLIEACKERQETIRFRD